ncbi:protein of unknown function [Paraburkholderia dioscoreae]|uniref:Uncharacterized protein n=1 Tax=Paraburkholderia dioscoreae TaxID=2604047 RepID=A0A5Q4ZDP5_9BURK|nr:protein of unknown function [Paraburkholderia dioscoreae]
MPDRLRSMPRRSRCITAIVAGAAVTIAVITTVATIGMTVAGTTTIVAGGAMTVATMAIAVADGTADLRGAADGG